VADWEQVLDALVRERGAALTRYASLLTGDTRDADDLVQEALVRSFSQGRPIREVAATEAYVRRAILTVFLDGYRRRRRWLGVRHLIVRPEVTDGPERTSPDTIDVRARCRRRRRPDRPRCRTARSDPGLVGPGARLLLVRPALPRLGRGRSRADHALLVG